MALLDKLPNDEKDRDGRKLIDDFRVDCQNIILTMKHHTRTQSTESGVQEISICSSNGKGEHEATALAMLRSFDNQPINKMMYEHHKTKHTKGNQHLRSGVGDADRVRISRRSMEAFRKRVISGVSERKRALPTKERSKALISRAIATMPTVTQVKDIHKRIRDNQMITGARDKRHAEDDAKRATAHETRKRRMRNNDSKLKHADQLVQRRCTVNAGYDGILTIATFSNNKVIEHCRKELTIRGVEDNDAFRKLGIKKLKEKLQSLVPEGTTEIELMHPDNVALGPLEISAIKRSKGSS